MAEARQHGVMPKFVRLRQQLRMTAADASGCGFGNRELVDRERLIIAGGDGRNKIFVRQNLEQGTHQNA